MSDLFGRTDPTFGGSFAADAALLTFSGITGVGLLTQQLNFGYQQNVTRLYEVGSSYQYYVVGRAQGSASLNRVLGPRPLLFSFYTTYGNACNAATNTISLTMKQGCIDTSDTTATATDSSMSLMGVLIQNVGFSIQAEQMMVNEQVQAMYVSLQPPDEDEG
jgi:hypothetical protein